MIGVEQAKAQGGPAAGDPLRGEARGDVGVFEVPLTIGRPHAEARKPDTAPCFGVEVPRDEAPVELMECVKLCRRAHLRPVMLKPQDQHPPLGHAAPDDGAATCVDDVVILDAVPLKGRWQERGGAVDDVEVAPIFVPVGGVING